MNRMESGLGFSSEVAARTVPDITSVATRTLHGPLAPGNHNSLSWSWNDLLAFGCQNQVIVAETRDPMSVVQTLDRHKYIVNKVKWPRDSGLRLASCDIKGNIIIWDVLESAVLTIISGESKELKNVLAINWVNGDTIGGKNPTGAYILVLYSSNTIVLYDAELGEVAWKKSFASAGSVDYNLKDISVDPFSKSNALLGLVATNAQKISCSFATIEGCLSNNVRMKRYQLNVRNDSTTGNSPLKSPNKVQLAVKQVATSLAKDGDELSNYVLEYKQISYSQSRRNELLLTFAREVVVINLTNSQIMTVIGTERNSSGIVEIYPCRLRSAVLSLQESGNVVLRLLQKNTRFEDHINTNVSDLSYTSLCHSEGIRLTKQNKIIGFSVSPTCETKMALLLNNGRVLIKRICRKGLSTTCDHVLTLTDLIPIEYYNAKKAEANGLKEKYKLIQCQLMGSLLTPTVIKSCPPITKYNWTFHRPLLASGDASGTVQIYDLATGALQKEIAVHSSPIRGIEWVSLNAFLTFSFPNLPRNHSGKISNELFLTDIQSGRSEAIRSERNSNSSPIESLKVSHLKQYFILTFKNEPFEIWDLKSLCLLRVMPKKFASVTAVEWSPLYNKRQSVLTSRVSEETNDGDSEASWKPGDEDLATADRSISSKERSVSPPDITKSMISIKENFVVTSGHGELYHFSVEGVITKEISCIPRDASHGSITCIAWKGDQVILGDADGNLHYWDLKKKQSSTKSSHRGWVKKVRFGPGRGNMKCIVLYSDGVEIWDVGDMTIHSDLKTPRDVSFKLLDIDWAGSDRPVLATSEGFILVTDLKLRKYTAPVEMSTKRESSLFKQNLHFVEPSTRSFLVSSYIHDESKSTHLLQRCIEVAKLMGDRDAVNFWNLVGHHIVQPGKCEPLDESYEMFLKNESFREIQREHVAFFELKRNKQEQNELCCEYHVLLGNHQRAVQLLLESDSMSRDKYYKDALKACLIAALQANNSRSDNISVDSENTLFSDTSAQPVVKLVATSLIASGAVEEGVQLLYLIGKVQDACRYLQSNGHWQKSIWVAKTYLTDDESHDLMRKWLDYLILQNEREVELFVLLAMRNFEKVLETLTNRQELQVAALFADICNESNVLPPEAKVTVDFVYLKYAQWLQEFGLEDIAVKYKNKVSE